MKKFLSQIDYKAVLLVMLSLSAPFVSPNIALPMAIFMFSGLILASKWFNENKKPDISEELQKEISAIKNQMSGIMIKNSAKPDEAPREFKRFF